MSSSLFNRSSDFSAGTLAGVRNSLVKGANNSSGSAYDVAAMPVSGMMAAFGADQSQHAARYKAALKDHPYAAIRPVAVTVADQTVKVGRKKIATPSRRGDQFITKGTLDLAFNSSPKFIKSLSEGIDIIEDHDALTALENPNEHLSQWGLMWCTAFSLEAAGEAIWVLDVDDFGRRSIWYWPRTWIAPVAKNGSAYFEWKLTIPGVPADLFPAIPGANVVRFSYPNPSDPTSAHSPLHSQARSITTDDHIQEAQLASMKNVTKPGMILIAGDMDATPGGGPAQQIELTPEQRKQLTSAIRLAYRGAIHYGDPLILDRLIKDVKPYMANPSDLDLQGGSQLTKDRIMQGIGTNPIIAGQIEGANRASAYVAQDVFYRNKVNPLIELISQELTRKYAPRFAAPGEKLYVWLTRAKPQDADLELSQMEFLAAQNWLRPSKALSYFDMPDEPLLDQLWETSLKKSIEATENTPEPTQGEPATKAVVELLTKGGEEKYYPPKSARNNARKVLKWKREKGDDVKGMTPVGWGRARQLASGQALSKDVVKRMAQFNRHRKNAEVAPEHKGEPWKDAGHVAWLGWGGTTGIDWAISKSAAMKEYGR